MNRAAELFEHLLADMATRITARAVQIDPVLKARLNSFHGSTVELQCTLPPSTWHLCIEQGTVHTRVGPAEAPDAVVRGTMLGLIMWLLPRDHTDGLETSGDQALLLELADILQNFSPDPTTPLRALLGTELADTLAGTAELGFKTLQSMAQEALGKVRRPEPDQPPEDPRPDSGTS